MKADNWMQRNWRSGMAIQYLVVCLFDFMIAPILTWLYSYVTSTPIVVWVPLTIQGGSMYHLSMGAICGVTSWSKSKEKIAQASAEPT